MVNSSLLAKIIAEHKRTGQGGVASVCSAHPVVLDAAAEEALAHNAVLLVEATSNQVDQFGGYTGLTPKEFITQTRAQILDTGFPADRLVFGGDHLGPNTWQNKPAKEAMELADELIRQYSLAGFDKIHLDCSMSCADDPVPLDDRTVAERAARLCKISEDARKELKDAKPIVYIIGTEVPVPGGAQEDLEKGVTPTTPDAARQTYAVHKEIFAAHGLSDEVWSRVIGLVVQPGVEFDHHQVVDYKPERAVELSKLANEFEYAVFEAHSTDYQTATNMRNLVRDHFGILKVGPALTFAYREALFALNRALLVINPQAGVDIAATIERVMCAEPGRWKKYYHGNEHEVAILRAYSLSDRIRYYWPHAEIRAEVEKLINTFDAAHMPYGILHQYLPQALEVCHDREEKLNALNLIKQHIRFALTPYYEAAGKKK